MNAYEEAKKRKREAMEKLGEKNFAFWRSEAGKKTVQWAALVGGFPMAIASLMQEERQAREQREFLLALEQWADDGGPVYQEDLPRHATESGWLYAQRDRVITLTAVTAELRVLRKIVAALQRDAISMKEVLDLVRAYEEKFPELSHDP